jgi:hypothetical protein
VLPIALFLAVQAAPAAELLWSADLESSDGELSSYGQTGQWEWGEVTSGPMASYDGSACWATQLGGWYLNDAEDHLELPALPTSDAARPVLALKHWYRFQSGDLGCLEVQQEGNWIEIEPIYGYPDDGGYAGVSDGWEPAWADLSGLLPGAAVRLTIRADGAGSDQGWYVDELELWDGDVAPPLVVLDGCLEDTEQLDQDYLVQAVILDDVEINTVLLAYRVDGGGEHRVPMRSVGGDSWEGVLPAQELGSTISYVVEASDGQNSTTSPDPACSFELRLPVPTQLRGPDDLVRSDTALLSWTAPQSEHTVVGYRVYRDDRLELELAETRAEVELVTGEQEFAVSALYEVGESAVSEPVVVEAAVPRLVELEPAHGYQGDTLRLRLEGEYLLLVQDDLLVELGEGVQVTEYDVRDVDLAFVTVSVAASAEAGLRELVVTSGEYELAVPEAFELLPGADRPKLTGLEPDAVRQGDEVELSISVSQALADLPTVWLGESILVESVTMDQPDSITVSIVVPYDTPLGLHALEVDDGVRIFSGPKLQVRDYIAPVSPDGKCSSVPGTSGLAALLAGLAALLVRRRAQTQRSRPPSTGMLVPRR